MQFRCVCICKGKGGIFSEIFMSKPTVDIVLESDEAAEQSVAPVPDPAAQARVNAPVSPWVHFFAGGLAGMAGATLTSPLDVVKTRLQSSTFHNLHAKRAIGNSNVLARGARHVSDTFGIVANVYRTEGGRALFRGLGPNLAGAVPARAVNFFTYGLAKDHLAPLLDDPDRIKPQTHLMSGVVAGFLTSTATNPIWVVKTRLQLDKAKTNEARLYKNSIDCFQKIWRREGVRALYRGLSASFLGSSESSMQWVLYEQMRRFIKTRQDERLRRGHGHTAYEKFMDWFATSGAAGAAKFMASLITYPHEVVRTRLRQGPSEGGRPKYTGLVQCFRRVIAEEGISALYGGLTPHLLRTVPNSIIMFGTWDLIVRLVAST